ncbi:MAG TPA: hypothetical protein VE007_05195 [Thermoanaerobaculia bacterium]|nr:hypothetical protein [Thermoanaerobaculia bacterium]
MNEQTLAKSLGWFSVALGAAELAAPETLCKALGVKKKTGLVRGFGAREVAAGIGILSGWKRAPFVWSRVAGDALDLGALGAALRRSRRKAAVGVALASVLAVTALDVFCGMRLSREPAL